MSGVSNCSLPHLVHWCGSLWCLLHRDHVLATLKVLTGWGWGTWSSPVLCVGAAHLQFWSLPGVLSVQFRLRRWAVSAGPGLQCGSAFTGVTSLNIGHCCCCLGVRCGRLLSVECLLLHYIKTKVMTCLFKIFYSAHWLPSNRFPRQTIVQALKFYGSIDLGIKLQMLITLLSIIKLYLCICTHIVAVHNYRSNFTMYQMLWIFYVTNLLTSAPRYWCSVFCVSLLLVS